MLLASDKVKWNLILKSVDEKFRISSVKLKMSANVISHVILDMPFQVVELKAFPSTCDAAKYHITIMHITKYSSG